MQIQNIQSNNTTFGAKVNVIGAKFDEKVMATLAEKAKNIGLENDVVELEFNKLISSIDRHSYHTNQDKSLVNYMYNEFSQIFKARFLPGGNSKASEQYSDRLIGLNYEDMGPQREQVANNYIDKLVKKLGNRIY